MPDRIYVTFTPTTVPGTYHAAIHYERSDPTGTITKHVVIEAQPENLDKLSAEDKALGVIEEAFRNDDGPSRFGRIVASASEQSADKARNDPFETIAEGDDLSEHLARMRLYASGINRAGFAYRGDHQNSNTFASGALRAAGLPLATGVAHDPAGPPGELLDFFAPGLNEPLKAPIGDRSSYDPAEGFRYASSAAAGREPLDAYHAGGFPILSRRVIPRGMDYSMDAPVDRPAVTASPVTELPNSQRPARPTAGNNIRLLGRRIVGTSQLSPLGIGTSTIPDHQDASDRRLPAGFDYRTALTPPASVPQQPGPMAFPPNTDFVRYLRQRALRANDHETSESEEFSLGA